MHPIVLIFILDLVVVAPLAAWLADQKGRSPSLWFITGAIAGPVALLGLGLAPASWVVEEARRKSRRCERCDSLVSLEARHCSTCDAELPAAPTPEPEPRPEPQPVPAQAPVIQTIVGRRSSRQVEDAAAVEAPLVKAHAHRAAASASSAPLPSAIAPRATASAAGAPPPAAAAPRASTTRATALNAASAGPAASGDRRRTARAATAPELEPVGALPGRSARSAAASAPPDAIVAGAGDDGDEPDDGKGDDLMRRRGVENVATGVFAGGVSELGAGYRYLISVSPRMLYVSGPIDVAPHHVVFRAPRSQIDATLFDNDLVIVAESPGGRKRQLVFRGIAGSAATQILALLDRDRRPVARRRAPGSGGSPA